MVKIQIKSNLKKNKSKEIKLKKRIKFIKKNKKLTLKVLSKYLRIIT